MAGGIEHRPIDAEEALLDVAGPFAAAAHSLTSWAMNAAPDRVCVYARITRLSRGGVGERARQLAAQGLVRLMPQRVVRDQPGLFDYRVQRTALRWSAARAVPDERGLSPDARMLFDLMAQIADEGERCPPDRDLAALLGFKRAEQAGRLMSELRRRSMIAIEHLGEAGAPLRVVTISETGAQTMVPAAKAQAARKRAAAA